MNFISENYHNNI